jgi:flagellin
MNLESQQLISEIDRVASNAAFNGSKLIDGTYQNQDFQVGAGNNAEDRIRISIGSAKASALGTIGSTSGTSTQLSNVMTATALAAGDLTINGYAISASTSDNLSFAKASSSAIAKANAINASSGLTGVTATVAANTFSLAALSDTTGVAIAAGDLTINGVDIGSLSAVTAGGTAIASRRDQLIGAINAKTAQTGVSAAANTTTGVIDLTAADGRNVTVTKNASPAGLTGLATAEVFSKVTLTSTSGASTIAISGANVAYAGLTASATSSMTTATVTGQTVGAVDLSTQASAQKALTILDSAIDTVTNSRANLGAYQNRFAAAISNLENTSTNLQASRSRILDTDYAKETTNLAKAQIVQQAATAMLAQANQSAQSVLALLK